MLSTLLIYLVFLNFTICCGVFPVDSIWLESVWTWKVPFFFLFSLLSINTQGRYLVCFEIQIFTEFPCWFPRVSAWSLHQHLKVGILVSYLRMETSWLVQRWWGVDRKSSSQIYWVIWWLYGFFFCSSSFVFLVLYFTVS